MPRVEITPHLHRYFPQLKEKEIIVNAGSVAELIKEVNKLAPGFSNYIVDERGALRRHVRVSINNAIVVDRKALSDYVPENGTLFIFPALSGG